MADRWSTLKERLDAAQREAARELGFPIGSIVTFTDEQQDVEPGFRGWFVVTGVIASMQRVELDTWPRTKRYTCVDRDYLRLHPHLPGRCGKCDSQACLQCRARIVPEASWEKTTCVLGDCVVCAPEGDVAKE